MLTKLKYYLLFLILFASPKAFGLAEYQQTLEVYAPTIVEIKSINIEKTKGIINEQTGNLSDILASFDIASNTYLYWYNLILTAKTNTQNGMVDAFYSDGNNMYLIFANTNDIPSKTSVDDIKTASPSIDKNPNVIAYTSLIQSENLYRQSTNYDLQYGGAYYLLNAFWPNAKLQQLVSGNPLNNTFSLQHDKAGIYQTVVTLTAISKF